MFRGVFLLSEGTIGAIDATNYAIGSSLIQNFYFNNNSIDNVAARATVYESKSGGRILNNGQVLGRRPANDPGNGSGANDPTDNSDDVYRIYWNGDYQTDFCASYVPNSQTVFGVYAPVGNAMVYRVNPSVQPGVRSVYVTSQNDGRIRVECPCDGQQMNLRDKYRCRFATRSGIVEKGNNGTIIGGYDDETGTNDGRLREYGVNEEIRYEIFSTSELMPRPTSDGHPAYNDQTKFDDWTGESDDHEGFSRFDKNEGTEATCEDVSQVIAGLQSSWDDSLIEGEKYKIGTAEAVCYARSSKRFVSTADKVVDNSNDVEQNKVTAEFKVTKEGVVGTYTPGILQGYEDDLIDSTGHGTSMRIVGTGGYQKRFTDNNNTFVGGHILRYAEAFITSSRPVNALELSIRSALGIRTAGLCNFGAVKKYEFIDDKFCRRFKNADADEVTSIRHTSDTITAAVERYSFFKVYYKIGNSNWAEFNNLIGVKGETQQNQFNYIRVELKKNEPDTVSVKLAPVSGFEIRYLYDGNLSGPSGRDLYILNSNYDTSNANYIQLNESQARLIFHGEKVNLNRNPFLFALGRNSEELASFLYSYQWKNDVDPVTLYGLPYSDDDNYVDAWGKLAEMFPYTEITSSAQNGPEHEVVAVNEIVKNTAVPRYDSMALIGLNIQSSTEFTQLPQFSAYVTEGIKVRPLLQGQSAPNAPSHLFPEILLSCMVKDRWGTGKYISDDMIDLDSFTDAAQFCKNNNYYFDGAIAEPVNLRTWAADTANMMLLQFGERQGKFFLQRAFPNGNVQIADQFSAGNILEGSFNFQYLNPEDRAPIEVSVTYREESEDSTGTGGRFPVTRELRVEEVGQTAVELESIDMSGFCTNREHAIDVAKYMILVRRLTDHIIKFKTTHEAALTSLNPGDYIRVGMESTPYGLFNNGVVGLDGTITATQPFEPGSYEVIGWEGQEGVEPAPMTLVVNADGKSDQFGLIFTVPHTVSQVKTYLIERITSEEDGVFSIEASHAQMASSGNQLKMTELFNNSSNWSVKP